MKNSSVGFRVINRVLGIGIGWDGIGKTQNQGTFNCGILVGGVGGSGDPRRKWEVRGKGEREKERKGREKIAAFVCKMI